MGILVAKRWPEVVQYCSLEDLTSGRMDEGIWKRSSSSWSHFFSWILNIMVRLALVISVRCSSPPVIFQTSQLSTVPKQTSPLSAFSLAPSTWSNIHLILVAEKYASMIKPVFSLIREECPSSFNWLQ